MTTQSIPKNTVELLTHRDMFPKCEFSNGQFSYISEVDKLAGRIAGKRARFHSMGCFSIVDNEGKRLSKSEAMASKGSYQAVIRNGSGNPLDLQAIHEMRLAARASLIESVIKRESKFNAIKAASKAASSELHHATRETVFNDVEKANKAHDRAYNFARATWEIEGENFHQSQPNNAEFLADRETENLNPRSLIARALNRARKAIKVFYASKPYHNRAKSDCQRDLNKLRDLARKIDQGIARQAARDNMAEYMKLRRLADRSEKGFELIAENSQPKINEIKLIQCNRESSKTILLPVGRLENWMHDFNLGLIPIAKRIIGNASADNLGELVNWKFSMR